MNEKIQTPLAYAYTWRNFANTQQLGEAEGSVLAVLVAIFRKSLAGCKRTITASGLEGPEIMEIGWPSNVRHVAHVTFDRFNGFLGLPVEFEPEVPRRPPSARGNCVPTILLMMQRRLYAQGGLQSEGIFRINPANGQEEYVREQLNNGLIPDDIDVHCIAGLIKAWFRELPRGVLDPLSPDQVMEAQSEDECTHLMSDPLTALMYAVQVMNFLKTLILKTLRQREDSICETCPMTQLEPSNEVHHNHSISKPISLEEVEEPQSNQAENITGVETQGLLYSLENIDGKGNSHVPDNSPADSNGLESEKTQSRTWRFKMGQPSNSNSVKKGSRKRNVRNKDISVISDVTSQPSRGEAWR
ncbi:rho GTPase-activating protein 1 [Phtheirospermum japonicum]|uniref:Rho GTPase-activating protein 1 n=1 Tax=Phtheirospermum japonicum TaxID=374723 RepID=A0A830CJS1_9LAMI|nr:rho GTPase-activating protein 1 [Phtheirospermum japonicum]